MQSDKHLQSRGNGKDKFYGKVNSNANIYFEKQLTVF